MGRLDEAGGIVRLRADRADPAAIRAVIDRHHIDIVIDMVAYTLAETTRLLAVLDGAVAHYILISSLDVYRNYGLLHGGETGAPDPGPLSEAAALRKCLYPYRDDPPRPADAADAWLDDYDKIPIEQAVSRMATPWTILRLPMVYGPGDRQRRFRWVLEPMLADAEIIALPPAWLGWTSTYGYVDNVAASIAATAGLAEAFREVFNVTDTDPVPHGVWLDRFARCQGWAGQVEARPEAPFPGGDAFAALDFRADLAVSGTRLHRLLGVDPPVKLDDALARTAADEKARHGE